MIEIPAGTWVIDPAHTDVSFWVRHLMISKVRGTFGELEGTVTTTGDIKDTQITGEIDVRSINTKDENRDAHLRSPDFFDTDKYPHIKFNLTDVSHVKGSQFVAKGELTIKDVTKEIEFDAVFEGVVKDPFGNTKLIASAEVVINRTEFGLTWNAALETGGVLVGEDVHIQIEAQAVLQQ